MPRAVAAMGLRVAAPSRSVEAPHFCTTMRHTTVANGNGTHWIEYRSSFMISQPEFCNYRTDILPGISAARGLWGASHA
jgi:hypothetical protein